MYIDGSLDMASLDERRHSIHYDATVYTAHCTFIARGALQPISRTDTNNKHFYRLDNEIAKENKYIDLVSVILMSAHPTIWSV